MPSITIKFDTVDFGATPESWHEASPIRVSQQEVPDRFGSVVMAPPVMGGRRVLITGTIFGTSLQDARDQMDIIRKRIFTGKRGKLYFWDDRYLNAYVIGDPKFTPVSGSAGLLWDYSIEFLGDDPFWYSTTAFDQSTVITAGSADATLDATGQIYRKDISVNNTGNAFAYGIFTITANQGTSLVNPTRLTNTTLTGSPWFHYNGTVSATKVLKIDFGQFTVTNDGVKDMNNILSGSTILWFEAGVNTIRYEGRPCTVKIQFTPRSY